MLLGLEASLALLASLLALLLTLLPRDLAPRCNGVLSKSMSSICDDKNHNAPATPSRYTIWGTGPFTLGRMGIVTLGAMHS